MGWKQWTAIAVVIGGGILLQIPGHVDDGMGHSTTRRGASDGGSDAAQGPYRTVTLDVTGMT